MALNFSDKMDEARLKETERFGITGKVVDITLIKSRTNATRKSVSVIFDPTKGRIIYRNK